MIEHHGRCPACSGKGYQSFPSKYINEAVSVCRPCRGRGRITFIPQTAYTLEACGWMRPIEAKAAIAQKRGS